MCVTIQEYNHFNQSEVLSLYESVGWVAYTRTPDLLARAYAQSLFALAAWNGKRLIGLLRAVGDGETIVFIQDLLVHPDFQRMGVGAALLQNTLKRYSHVRQIQLTADADAHLAAFYQSQGLRPLSDFGCTGYAE